MWSLYLVESFPTPQAAVYGYFSILGCKVSLTDDALLLLFRLTCFFAFFQKLVDVLNDKRSGNIVISIIVNIECLSAFRAYIKFSVYIIFSSFERRTLTVGALFPQTFIADLYYFNAAFLSLIFNFAHKVIIRPVFQQCVLFLLVCGKSC